MSAGFFSQIFFYFLARISLYFSLYFTTTTTILFFFKKKGTLYTYT